jgi:polar amino acid transport system substrate-binding protein
MVTRRQVVSAAFGAAVVSSAVSGAVSGAARAEGVLKVGSTPTGVPFTFLDTKTNTIQGIMVDLITALGKDVGFGVEIVPMQFSTLIPALTSSKIDIIAAAMFATPARAQIIDFTDTVITYGEGLVVPAADKTDYTTMAELKGKVVGAQVGTAFVEPLQKSGLFPEVKIYDTIPDILRDVNAGRIGAGFADYPIVAYNLQLGGFPNSRLVRTYKPTIPGSVGIGLRKGDPLRDKLNASLVKLKADGSVGKILAKWGLE